MHLVKGIMASGDASGASEAILQNSTQLADLLQGILETLSKACSKNDSLLEALESAEMKATQGGNGEVLTVNTYKWYM